MQSLPQETVKAISRAHKKKEKKEKKEKKRTEEAASAAGTELPSVPPPEPLGTSSSVRHPSAKRPRSPGIGALLDSSSTPKKIKNMRKHSASSHADRVPLSNPPSNIPPPAVPAPAIKEASAAQAKYDLMRKKYSGLVETTSKKVLELEQELERRKSEIREKEEMVARYEEKRETLKEALNCGVCFETLRDPHVLSCGHIACKDCLKTWFRTPGAYVHEVDITADTDLSYRTKMCLVCRARITRRPAPLYLITSLLDPLDLAYDPCVVAAPNGEFLDPWQNLFPVDRDAYKVRDHADEVDRCPACGCEITDGECMDCGAEFSDSDDYSEEDEGQELDESDVEGDEHVHRIMANLGRGVYGDPRARAHFIDEEAEDSADDSAPDDGEAYTRAQQAGFSALEARARGEGGHDSAEEPGSSEDGYGGSFIDDGEEEEWNGVPANGPAPGFYSDDYYHHSEDEEDEEGSSIAALSEDEDEDESEADVDAGEPSAEVLRRRRVARFGPHRVITVRCGSEDSADAPAPPPQRQNGSRRNRAIVIDSDSD
ncbi:hypothetical protein P7C73_g433, partial [Tremellales sp. Uapishka_1]